MRLALKFHTHTGLRRRMPRMSEHTEEALRVVKTAPNDEFEYLAACHFLATHRDELTHRVFICLSGGLSENNDPRWEEIKQNSQERCSCGNERVILPGNPRTTFEASSGSVVVVSPKCAVYLKPIGGDKESAFLKLWIIDKALAFMADPCAPLVLSMDIFSTQGYPLAQLAKILPEEAAPLLMTVEEKDGAKIPLLVITAVDPVAQTVSITLDAAVEAFDPESAPENPKNHSCTNEEAGS
jgi:hypothetical protein